MKSKLVMLVCLAFLLALAIGCSGTDESPSAPDKAGNPQIMGQGLPPLYFIMEFNPADWSVTIRPKEMPREAGFDVTPWAKVTILSAVWIPSERNWYVTAQLRNTSQFKGYGVWAVFTEMGLKVLRNIDGFIYYGPQQKRVPFIAIRKDAPFREFPGYHVETQEVVIHWPIGVESWDPIEFYIDASWPDPRPLPMVEDLSQVNFPPPCYHYAIQAHVQDFQSPSADLTVWADLSSYGAGDNVPMFDDGEHADLDANDGIFGAEFDPGSIFGTYTFTVYAKDPQNNSMENDLLFGPIEFPPLPPIQWDTIEQGTQSGIHEEKFELIKDHDSWVAFWDMHGSNQFPPPPLPDVDFETKMVAVVMLGPKPDSCYTTEITNVDWSSENCGIMVYYNAVYPEPDCLCFDVINYPYHFITVPKSEFEYGFKGTDVPLICNCLEWTELSQGPMSGIAEQGEWQFTDQKSYEAFWDQLTGGGSEPPYVDFDTQMVFAFTQGTKPSSGYYINLIDICLNDFDELEVNYHRMIPGASCMVLWVITTPYLVVAAEKDPSPVIFKGVDEVYECD